MYQLKPRSIDDLLISVTDTATLLFSLVDTASSAQNSKAYYGNERSPGDGVANAVSIRAEDGDVRIAIGATPTATKGFQIKQGTRYFFHGELENLKLIRTGSANVAVEIAFWRAERGENVTGNTDAVTLTTGDIEIGAVEIKNGASDVRALVSPANTARNATDNVIQVQTADAAGNTPVVETAGADAVSNTANALVVIARLKGFNGTTWDRIRSGITACTATLTGFLNTLPWAVYNATPTTRTEGQGGPMQANSLGSLETDLQTKIAGEDLTNDVMKVQPQCSYANISASALIKTGAGQFFGFIVNSCAATATVKFWAQTTAAVPVLLNTMTFTAAEAQGPKVFYFPAVSFTAGLYCTIAVAAADVTVIYN